MDRSVFFVVTLLAGFVSKAQDPQDTEFRGVWIATINNIDWPPVGELRPEKQKAAFIELLDYYESLNFNAVIVQIRPSGDAFYPSELAPWSRFLTGEEGNKGKWTSDPLNFMIQESHKRGMEFHAWLNPYRASCNRDVRAMSTRNLFFQKQEWVVPFGTRYYLDPGIPEAQDYIVGVVDEVISNYDVDAIHFDDYFYPYPIEGEGFNDRASFVKYGIGQFEERADWRRSNVDSLVKKVSNHIRKKKPEVRFGISPFGVWRNIDQDRRGSRTNAAHTTYDDLYADALSWIDNEWVDYLAPQLYWSSYFDKAPYPVLAKWWHRYGQEVDIYIGHGMYKVGEDSDRVWNDLNEIPRQIAWNRSLVGIHGSIFYSARSLQQYPMLAEKLRKEVFTEKVNPAISFERTNLGAPNIKNARAVRNTLFIDLDLKGLEREVESVAILSSKGNKPAKLLLEQKIGSVPGIQLALYGEKMDIVVTYLNEDHQMGESSEIISIEKENGRWEVSLF